MLQIDDAATVAAESADREVCPEQNPKINPDPENPTPEPETLQTHVGRARASGCECLLLAQRNLPHKCYTITGKSSFSNVRCPKAIALTPLRRHVEPYGCDIGWGVRTYRQLLGRDKSDISSDLLNR
jgi:hypothetical protein